MIHRRVFRKSFIGLEKKVYIKVGIETCKKKEFVLLIFNIKSETPNDQLN